MFVGFRQSQSACKRLLTSRLCPAKSYSSSVQSSNLCGRDVIQPNEFTLNDWKNILWIAFDLKKKMLNKGNLNILCDKHITFLFTKANVRNLLSCSLGSQLLGARSTYYFDPEFESQPNIVDGGRALASITDALLVNGCHQTVLTKIAEGSSVPVIGLSTNMYSILKALAFLMTIQETYGHIKNIKLAWIGPSSPLCNTLLSIFPSFGINIRICCICDQGTGPMTPMGYEDAILSCNKGLAEIHQFSTAAEAIYRSNVIIAVPHPEEENKVTLKLLEEAEFEWIFLHPLPRSEIEVSDDVFDHKNNLTWECSTNHLYVAMAFMASTLKDYSPTSQKPTFEASVTPSEALKRFQ